MTRRLRVAARRQSGFTLVELVISMALIGIIFAVYSVTMSSTIHTSAEVQEDAVLQGEVRAAVDALAKDLRQAYTGNGSPALETMTASQIQFLSPDRATPFHLRRINYRVTSGRLERAAVASTNTGLPPWTFPALGAYSRQVGSVVSTNVFTYYDGDGTVTATPADVAGVTIRVVVALPQSPTRQFTYATSVALRVEQ
jgi:prepilin-type N-terminal cleavage/methylation domain-containing protein